MIKFADQHTAADVRHIWDICFGDTKAFADMYFAEKYKHENTLVYLHEGKVVAATQLLPYTFTFYGKEIPAAYISGASTLPEYRNKGFMGKLLKASFDVMQQRNIPLSVLIPAEEWLYGYYANCGYEKVFEKDNAQIPLRDILEATDYDIDMAYSMFNSIYRPKDFTVQKTKDDFKVIIKDAKQEGFPVKTNVSGMARIIDAPFLLSCYAAASPGVDFSFHLTDVILSGNNASYSIKGGNCSVKNDVPKDADKISINEMCRLLFGFRLQSLPARLTRNFTEHKPIMNLMLE